LETKTKPSNPRIVNYSLALDWRNQTGKANNISKVKIARLFNSNDKFERFRNISRVHRLNVREFIDSVKRLLHVTTKPSRDEISLMVKISFLGVAIVGSLGFIIRVLFLFLNLLPAAQTGTTGAAGTTT
jgi:protein translocase SEC61 complex gamma subunit